MLEETIHRLNLTMTPDQLAKKLDISPVRATQLVTVAVSDPSSEQVAKIADTIGQVFIDQTQDQNVATISSSRDALQKEIDAAKQHVDDLTTQIADLRAQTNALTPAVQAQITGLETQLSQYQSTYNGLVETSSRLISRIRRQTRRFVSPSRRWRPRSSSNRGCS